MQFISKLLAVHKSARWAASRRRRLLLFGCRLRSFSSYDIIGWWFLFLFFPQKNIFVCISVVGVFF